MLDSFSLIFPLSILVVSLFCFLLRAVVVVLLLLFSPSLPYSCRSRLAKPQRIKNVCLSRLLLRRQELALLRPKNPRGWKQGFVVVASFPSRTSFTSVLLPSLASRQRPRALVDSRRKGTEVLHWHRRTVWRREGERLRIDGSSTRSDDRGLLDGRRYVCEGRATSGDVGEMVTGKKTYIRAGRCVPRTRTPCEGRCSR